MIGVLDMDQFISFSIVLLLFVFVWDPHIPGWHRPALPCLSTMAGLIQHFRSVVVDA